jgi:type I restriction enzyme S subunit
MVKAEDLKVDDNLPQGWTIAKLIDIVTHQKGKKPKILSDVPTFNFVPYLDIEAFINNNIRQYADPESSKISTENDVLIVWDGARSGLTGLGKEGAIGSTIVALTPLQIEQKYLLGFLQTKYDYINGNHRGSGIPHVDPDILWNIDIPIAPLNEQKRIVAKLEKLLTKVNESCDRLSRIPTILKRFRQSVLASACSGRLTADWRQSHPDIEPAEELLKKDQKDELSELPENWYFVLIGDVINNLKYGTSKKCDYENKGIPVLRIPNIAQGIIDHSELKYAELSETEYETLKLKQGDILIIRSNGSVSLVGKSAIISKSEEGFAYAGYLIRLRPNVSLIDPSYLNYYLSSYEIRVQIELPARSTSGVNNINSTEVKNLEIAVPPLEEQKEIVKRVKALFRKCDLIEQRYLNAKAYTDKLTQSILAKAFRGELVPQDSNDEPAEVLLERIREEKTLIEKSSKSKKTSKRKTT